MKKESFTSQAVKGSIWNTLYSMIQRIGGLVFAVIIARTLLPEKFGLYNIVLSIASIFMIFSYGGIDQLLIRYVSEVIVKNKFKAKSYFDYILKLKIILSLFVFVIILLISYPFAFFLFKKPELLLPLIFSSFFVFVFSLTGLFSSLFFVLKKIKYLAIKEIIYQMSRIFFFVLIFLIFSSNFKLEYIFLVLFFASFLTLSFVFNKSRQKIRFLFEGHKKIENKEKRRLLKFLSYTTIGSISLIFFGYTDTLILGLLISDASFIGLYRAAFILISSISGFLAFAPVLLPIFMQIEDKNLEQAFNKVVKYLAILAIPASFGIALLGKYFLVIMYGYEYLGAAPILLLFAPLITIGVFNSLFTVIFSVKERPKDYLPLLGFVTVVNIFLNFVLIYFLSKYSYMMGTIGAAIAILTSWILYCIGLCYLVRKKFTIKTDLTLLIKPTIASGIMVSALSFILIQLQDFNIFIGLILILFGILLYFFTMLILRGIGKEEFTIFINLFNGKTIGIDY
jgi:O-antigen/teichoic acid export membrane protein